jgi:hypothetical protein
MQTITGGELPDHANSRHLTVAGIRRRKIATRRPELFANEFTAKIAVPHGCSAWFDSRSRLSPIGDRDDCPGV